MSKAARMLCALVGGCAAEASTTSEHTPALASETIELEEAKLLIEHNATDRDTGFQGFVDGEAVQQLDIRDPDGKPVVSFSAQGNAKTLGLTELFFETEEPANDDVPIEEVLARLPEGDYDFLAKTVDGPSAHGVASLSHKIPAGPEIVSPAADAVIDPSVDLVVRWRPVTHSTCADNVTITHYELIVERADQPVHRGFGTETLDIHMPSSRSEMRVPREFLQPGTDYKLEVLAIEANGNQTLSASTFSTR